MFRRASDSATKETLDRETQPLGELKFGVTFLDHAFRGILRDDLVLVGASSGVGKTQLVVNIAKVNVANQKKVHLFALESSLYEIERRLKYPIISQMFYEDQYKGDFYLNYTDWMLGKYRGKLDEYEKKAAEIFESKFQNLFIFEHGDKFGVNEFIEAVLHCHKETDLIICDHVHYFDFDGDENKALKLIAKTLRTMAIDIRKPIVAVAHLRKRDRSNEDLAPGMEEFHGSSDLFKIATKVVTIAPGRPSVNPATMLPDGNYETYFRIPKNRIDSSSSRFLGQCYFDPKKGSYGEGYKLGWEDQKRGKEFVKIAGNFRPHWAAPNST